MRCNLRWIMAAFALLIPTAVRSDEKIDPKVFADKVVGIWEVHDPELTKIGGKATLEFTKDGKIKMSFEITGQKPIAMAGTYKVEGHKLTLTRMENGKELTETIAIKTLSDDKIVLDDKGKNMELKRKAAAKEAKKKESAR